MASTELSSQVLPPQKVRPLCLVPVSFVLGQQSCRPLLPPVPSARPREVGIRMEGILEALGLGSPHGRQEPVESGKQKNVLVGWEEPSSFTSSIYTLNVITF